MGLFKPEIGLVFWMLVVFLIILAILAKYAWPVIIRSIEQRSDFIDSEIYPRGKTTAGRSGNKSGRDAGRSP